MAGRFDDIDPPPEFKAFPPWHPDCVQAFWPESLGEPVLSPPGPVELLIVAIPVAIIANRAKFFRRNFFIGVSS